MRLTEPLPKTQAALLEAMQERTVTSSTNSLCAGSAIFSNGDAKSDRDGRHVSAAGSPIGPVSDEDSGDLSLARGFNPDCGVSRPGGGIRRTAADIKSRTNRGTEGDSAGRLIVAPHVQDFAVELDHGDAAGHFGLPWQRNQ